MDCPPESRGGTGTGCLIYPGCVHTRFDHILRTLALAKRILAKGVERLVQHALTETYMYA